jgi:NDP-sugar pyrophosphorylase family protein
MNIVVPMAGLGSRFRQAGFDRPKPLILVEGRPMYAWAVDSLPLRRAGKLIFILLRSQPEFEELRADVLSRYRGHAVEVLDVPALTAGQSETVMRAEALIDSEQPLLIHNADTAFEIEPGWVDRAAQEKLDGALLVFRSTETRWSYSRADEAGWVREVREKQPISPWASTGTYWFGRGRDFVRLARQQAAAQSREKGEFYVGPLYNELIAGGGRVRNFEIQRLLCFGTPEDLEAFLRSRRPASPGVTL